jgi:hypothetical protein
LNRIAIKNLSLQKEITMPKTNDIDGLFNAIEENPNQYQEITQFEDANKSLGRWSLISQVHMMDHSKEARSIWAQSSAQHASEKTPAIRPLIDAPLIKIVQLSKKINDLIVDTAHIKSASPDSISSLFLRLNHS